MRSHRITEIIQWTKHLDPYLNLFDHEGVIMNKQNNDQNYT